MPISPHLRRAAWLHVALSLVGLVASGVFIVLFVGGQAPRGSSVLDVLMGGGASTLLVLAVPAFLLAEAGVALALLQGAAWAQPALTGMSVLQLPNVPLGTLVGGYTLWAMYGGAIR